jgi:hypothetical protein
MARKDEEVAELGRVEFGNEGEEGADSGPMGVCGEKMELLLLLLLGVPLVLNPTEFGVELYIVLLFGL